MRRTAGSSRSSGRLRASRSGLPVDDGQQLGLETLDAERFSVFPEEAGRESYTIESDQGVGKRINRLLGEHNSGHAVLNGVQRATASEGDDRATAGHGINRQSFRAGRCNYNTVPR